MANLTTPFAHASSSHLLLPHLLPTQHYMAVTVKKISLLNLHVLRNDRSALDGAPLLARENVDDAALLSLARTVATAVGLPESTQFASPHPAKLFDFSTRARCVATCEVVVHPVLTPAHRPPIPHPLSHLLSYPPSLTAFPTPRLTSPSQPPSLTPLQVLGALQSARCRR